MEKPFELTIKLDKDYVQDYVKEMVTEYARPQLLFWDIEGIGQATSLGKTVLEENILNHPLMKVLERRRTDRGKRIWPVKESSEVIYRIIMDEW